MLVSQFFWGHLLQSASMEQAAVSSRSDMGYLQSEISYIMRLPGVGRHQQNA